MMTIRHFKNRAILPLATAISNLLPPTRCFGVRRMLFRAAGLRVADGVSIMSGVRFQFSNVSLGNNTWVGSQTQFICSEKSWIHIGARVDIAACAMFNTGSHEAGNHERRAGKNYSKTITIGDGTWIGMGAILLDGATVGAGCVIAAGAVVRGEFPEDVLIAGVPARIVKQLDTASNAGRKGPAPCALR
jgi:acetyltransferase-like isoleucine patch superfamily enzyme